MQITIQPDAENRIWEFYQNTIKAHSNTWGEEDAHKSFDKVYNEMCKVGKLQKTNKTLPKWQGCTVERSGNWYFAYKIENGTINVYGAEHVNNMSNNTFVSNDNRRTDGNYNPQQQFVTDNKKRKTHPLMEHIISNVIETVHKKHQMPRSKIESIVRMYLSR